MRLIDAKGVAVAIRFVARQLVVGSDWLAGYKTGLLAAVEEIEKCITVDAVQVVHGRWIEWYPPMHMIMTGEEMLYRCSVCDAKYPDVEGYKYCPHCGAMMDGEETG